MQRKMKTIVIIGAGGFAREVAWLIRDINRANPQYDLIGYIVSDLSKLGENDSRDEVLGDYSWFGQNRADCAAIGIGTPGSRLKVSSDLMARVPGLEWPALIHPTAQMDWPTCRIGKGILLCAGAIGTVNLVFDDFCMVNMACTLGHEAHLGRGVVLNPTVNISGGVIIEDGVLVGTGAQILQYITVGEGATVAAGAVVNKNVAPGMTVIGVPAKPLQRPGN
jgi:sugar O-acyltransferase (sialic acid O-acetyltransferase NeuD family)